MAKSAAQIISMEGLTEATTSAVLRALDARPKRPVGGRDPFGPIIVGIIMWPEGGGPNLPGRDEVATPVSRNPARSRK